MGRNGQPTVGRRSCVLTTHGDHRSQSLPLVVPGVVRECLQAYAVRGPVELSLTTASSSSEEPAGCHVQGCAAVDNPQVIGEPCPHGRRP